MPIKFRCLYCDQLMGIARRKAGTVVACPACQRDVTVPYEDQLERPKPPKSPLLEVEHFDRLIGKEDGARRKQTGSGVGLVEPAPPIVKPTGPTRQLPEPVFLAKPAPARDPEPAEESGLGVGLGALVAAAVCGAFGVGVAVGRYVVPATPSTKPAVVAQNAGNRAGGPAGLQIPPVHKEAASVATAAADAPAAANDAVVAPGIAGLIRFRGPTGDAADEGATVLIFPCNSKPPSKIVTLGLRPEDRAMQHRPGADALKKLGGAFAYVDDKGSFAVGVTDSGPYNILIISRHAGRPADQKVFIDDRSVLSEYFSEVDGLLASREYVLITKDLKPSRVEMIQFTFSGSVAQLAPVDAPVGAFGR